MARGQVRQSGVGAFVLILLGVWLIAQVILGELPQRLIAWRRYLSGEISTSGESEVSPGGIVYTPFGAFPYGSVQSG